MICPGGKYQIQSGQSACYSAGRGSHTYAISGTVSSTSGCDTPGSCNDSLMTCPIGQSGPPEHKATKAQKDAGFPCALCPAGTFQDQNSWNGVNEITCKRCPDGTYQNQPGQGGCTECAPGKFAPIPIHTLGIGFSRNRPVFDIEFELKAFIQFLNVCMIPEKRFIDNIFSHHKLKTNHYINNSMYFSILLNP